MAGSRAAAVLVLATAALVTRAEGQTQNLAALRQAISQAGGRVIVTFKSGSGATVRAPGAQPFTPSELNTIESRVQAAYPIQVHTQLAIVGAVAATVSDADVARLAADSNVYSIEPDAKNYLTAAASTSVPGRPSRVRADVIPWGVADVGAPAAWAAGVTGAGVKVGIIDSGIDYTHPDLFVADGYDFTSSSNSPSAYNDTVGSCDGHGTHVAGTVAAKQNGSGVVGVAPGASLYALRVFQDLGSGCFAFTSAQIAALQYAVTNHLDVVSISIGNSMSTPYANAVANAIANGVVVVAAAGNSGGPGVVYPAAAPGAIAVGAVDPGNTMAWYSSTGPELWVAAPGTNVESTVPGGGTGVKSGTSMATPHVTGLVALIRQMHPTWTVDQVRNEIKADAIDISPAGFDNAAGWGVAQAPSTGTVPVTVALSPSARSVSVQLGNAAAGDNATVTLAGTGAASTPWSATKKKAWLTLTTASGTGNGTVAWTRNTAGLAVGTYVDTVTVSAASSSAVVYDTLKITAALPPLVMTVAPGARSVSVQQGNAAPGDNATVTLSGTGASTATWVASKRQPWLTLTTSSWTGSGTVAWTRNATGLAVGTYVDTISIASIGAAGSPTVVYDTLKITAAAPPLVMTVAPAARSVSVQQGNVAPGDNATVTLSGTGASTATWVASKRQPWLTLTTSSWTGSGTVAWTRNATGLAVGTYVDTISIASAGAVGSPTVVYDTLKITAAAPPLVMTVAPGARSVSVQQGNVAPADNATVTLSGTGASTATWVASKRQPWLTLTTSSWTGSGLVAWTRNATGLAVGTYVDTISIASVGAAGSPTVVYDTLKITAALPPLVMTVAPGARSVSVQQGSVAPGDNAAVTLSGTGASNATWVATKKQAWLTLTTSSWTGSGSVAWTRNATGLAVGTYVDTISIASVGAAGSPTVVYDTLKITSAPPPLVMTVAPGARSVSVQQGNVAPGDNATVTLSGTGASNATWVATKRKPWLTLTTSSWTGSGTVAWTRNAIGLAVGTYVDTISIASIGAAGSPTVVYDTLKITAAPPPLVMAVAPGARSVSVQQGTAAPSDNAFVTLSGTGASSATWVATKRQPWLTLTTSSWTGSGLVAWTRNTTGLAAGTYVDTITIASAGAAGSPTVVYDTLKITAAAVPIVMTVSPGARSVAVQQGNAAPGDNAAVTLTGTGASTATWVATKKQPWLNLTTSSWTGSGLVAWTRNTTGLVVGTYVDTISIASLGATGSPTVIYDTLKITAAPIPIALAVSPAGRKVSVQQGGVAPSANASVILTGTGAAGTNWAATNRQPWLTLTTALGTGSGTVAWNRNTAGLGVGTYVDTITVSTAVTSSVAVVDTLVITSAPVPIVMTVTPGARSVSAQQGSAAPGDNAFVSLTGTGASTATWVATKRQPWLTLTTSSWTGSGLVAWTRNTAGLSAGTYVDTITIVSVGAVGSPTVVYDTLKITAVPVPVVMAVSPTVHTVSVPHGGQAQGDNAGISFTGTDAAQATWSITTSSAPWETFSSANGTGDGVLSWSRQTSNLAVGVYVDTITVSMNGSSQRIRVLDSVLVTAVAPTISLDPKAKKSRAMNFAGASLVVADADSAIVSGDGLDDLREGGWVATVSSGRLVLTTPSGSLDGWVKWSRPTQSLPAGIYVDTVTVSLVANTDVKAMFLDSLEVVAVSIPVPDIAVGDLFDHRSLTDDQRIALDRQGNNNGKYDLGDFLAWVSRNHIKLSVSASQKLKEVTAKAGGGGN